jgi:hypothetical protein
MTYPVDSASPVQDLSGNALRSVELLQRLALPGDSAEACSPMTCRSTVPACHRNGRPSVIAATLPVGEDHLIR